MRKTKWLCLNKLRLYLFFWAFLIIVFSAVILIQARNKAALSAEIVTLKQQISDASARQLALQQRLELKNSDKSVEDYAHSQLGLVHSNEIIIYNDNYKSDK